ncbi:MAG: hypothetical protein FJ298_08425 [Planctomycetes bacterium]|nr:hypothetical protein [Planctomycetota bacterium]
MRLASTLLPIVALASCASTASHTFPATGAAEQFERLKRLEGDWVALAGEGDAPSRTRVSYRVTSGGTALVETVFCGTPHEMATVYYLDGGALALVHYCLGNQPRMLARASAEPDVIRFEFAGGANIGPATAHMHAAEIRFTSAARLDTRWTHWKDGRAEGEVRLALVRAWD